MPFNWRAEYLSSLKDLELSSPVNMELVQACSQMADRISALEAQNAALQPVVPRLGSAPTANSNDPTTTQLRVDLAEALRSRGVTEGRLRSAEEELGRLRSRTRQDSRAISDLKAERTNLTTKINDREYELKEKRKLVEHVQDEMITLNLQLSVAEKERDKVKKENKELIDRWMKRMAQEADAMNLANEPMTR